MGNEDQWELLTATFAQKYEENAAAGILPGIAKRAEEFGGFRALAEKMVGEIRADFDSGSRYDWLKHNPITLGPVVRELFGFKRTKEWREAWTG